MLYKEQKEFLDGVLTVANEAAQEYLDLPDPKNGCINYADFSACSAAIGRNSYGEEFLIVFFEEGEDPDVENWLAERIGEKYPGVYVSCRLEW